MDDNASKSSTSLVVAEKNVRKPSGCVGIFCKLFDWNRRFAKKKLFPKKLLAPSRGSKVSKKLANEKTRHLLVDGDGDSKSKVEMSSPGLVARLMGLDSLPVVNPKNNEVVSSEKGRKMKSRPVSNRFGADAMHIKNVLSRSKKRHPKLASPVKSSRGSKNTIRLIGAATKILEPGLTNRAKCSLTYSNHNLPSFKVAVQSSCRNCDRESEVVLLRSGYEPEERMVQEIPFATNGKKHLVAMKHREKSVSSTSGLNYKKDFIAMNRNVSLSQFKFPRKTQYEVPQDNAFFTQGDIVTKRTASVCRHVQCSSSGRRPRFGTNVPNGREDIDSMSFSLNSPLIEESNNGEKILSPLSMNEDALSNILAQKLKELATQEEKESTAVTPQGRTAAVILQELISVLTAQKPTSPEFNDNNSPYTAMTSRPSQADARGKRLPTRFSGNHSSPGSVLDASFSNESCVSSTRDDSSGIYDSETYCNVPVSHLLDQISRALDRTNLPEMELSTAYSAYTKEVLFNCELLFGNAIDFLTGPFLNQLETLAIASWRETVISGFQISANRGERKNAVRKFLFDCLVECLSIRYDRYSNCGFAEWSRLSRKLNPEALIRLFDFEVRKSASLGRMKMTADEIVDWEMNGSLVKWADFEVEVFESGAEIGLIIFQELVDEIVDDFVTGNGCVKFL